MRFKYCYYTHLGKIGRKKKSLSNLRTPKQRNCKILNCKAKETHLIPQEFKYVFQLGYTIPHKDMEAHKNLETQYSHCALPAQSQLAPVPTNPGTCWVYHQHMHYLLGAPREEKGSTKCPFSSKMQDLYWCYFKSGLPAAKQATLNAEVIVTFVHFKAASRNTEPSSK